MKKNMYFFQNYFKRATDVTLKKCPKITYNYLHTCAPNSEIPSNIGSMNPSIRHDAAPSRVSNHPSTDNNLLLCACCAIYGSDLSRDNDTRESPPPPGSNPGETTRQPYWYPWHQYTHMALVLDGNSEKGAHVYNAIGNFICWMHLSQQ